MATAGARAWPAASSYRYLEGAGPADLAWEWLRRDPDFRRLSAASPAAHGAMSIFEPAPVCCTARWGCLNMPGAGQSWRDAPLLWSADVDPAVLKVIPFPVSTYLGTPFNLARCGVKVAIVAGTDREHVLLGHGASAVRLDVLSGSLLEGPTHLVHDLAASAEMEPVLAALRRFLLLLHTGRLPVQPSHVSQRLQRQALALRVHDALAEGASIRDVGVMLFGIQRVREEWGAEALKSQCRRLIALAREMASGGYRALLR